MEHQRRGFAEVSEHVCLCVRTRRKPARAKAERLEAAFCQDRRLLGWAQSHQYCVLLGQSPAGHRPTCSFYKDLL